MLVKIAGLTSLEAEVLYLENSSSSSVSFPVSVHFSLVLEGQLVEVKR